MTANQAQTQQQAKRLPSKRTLYMLFLLFLFVAYWIFVWRMERIILVPTDLPFPILHNLPHWLVNIAEIFMPRVLRHFIPLFLGWMLAHEIATNLVFHLYDLPDRSTARGFLRRLRDPRRSGGAVISVTPQELEFKRGESARLRVGGPGRVSIPAGHAAVTEMNGRYYRVISSGGRALDRFEYLHSVYDLRPQDRTDAEVVLRSSEGLEFLTSVSITFRIDTPEMAISAQQPYPYDPETIRKLAYNQINLPGGDTSNWEDAALTTVKGALANTVAAFSLNELLQDEQTEIGTHLTIRRSVEREARTKLADYGIDLIRVRIGGFRFPEDITDLHIQYWRSFWDSQARLTIAEGQAVALEEMEVIRAEAEIELVKAVANGMQQAQQQGYEGSMSDAVALRFVETLQRMALESGNEIDLPDQMLPQLQDLQNQLQLGAETDSTIDGEVTPTSTQSPDQDV